jgi:hypothetical protein
VLGFGEAGTVDVTVGVATAAAAGPVRNGVTTSADAASVVAHAADSRLKGDMDPFLH